MYSVVASIVHRRPSVERESSPTCLGTRLHCCKPTNWGRAIVCDSVLHSQW